MKVAVLFSGGKDSCLAVKHCMDHGWDTTLIAVQPRSAEAYIWHYPAVWMTKLSAEAMNLPIIQAQTDEIGSQEEVLCLNDVFSKNKFDAVVLGGVGLQETQIREVKKIADKFGMKTIVPYTNLTSEQLLKEEIDSGLDILLTEAAAGGLTKDLIGMQINNNFLLIKQLSEKHGFDVLGEGGSYNTFVTDAPFFKKRIDILDYDTLWDDATRSGYMDVHSAKLVEKIQK